MGEHTPLRARPSDCHPTGERFFCLECRRCDWKTGV